MHIKSKVTAIAAAVSLMVAVPGAVSAKNGKNTPYEVWGSDQSNSVEGENRGSAGSRMWIWNSEDVDKQVKNGTLAQPLGCDGNNVPGDGPCDLLDVFPADLAQHDGIALTGATLGSLPKFGKLHGMLADPQNRYMNVNSFVTGGGYVGIMDGRTKEAVALFRVTEVAAGARRSVHMSFWNSDGSALLVANLHGKILERIDIFRDPDGNITAAVLDRAASLGVGKGQTITEDATAFTGNNAHGNPLVSTVAGSYDLAAFGDYTPNGYCKENGCDGGTNDYGSGGRPGNVIVCPIVSGNDHSYITMGGGGLLVADTKTTPMSIIGEYGKGEVNGAGCGGIQVGKYLWLNAGASAASSGLTQSTFAMYNFDDTVFETGVQPPNTPLPNLIFKDAGNTATLGNEINNPGADGANLTGQLPGISTRRDAHGATRTLSGKYIHNADRIQNIVEVFSTKEGKMERVATYDLTSKNGKGKGTGPCAAFSVTDDPNLPGNDPAPDLMEASPDGKYLMSAFRGPAPASVLHAAQGSCPGVGVIKLLANGKRGKLATVLRTSHSTPDIAPGGGTAPGGIEYIGAERSDIHGASVRTRVEDMNDDDSDSDSDSD